MARPSQLEEALVDVWLGDHPEWARTPSEKSGQSALARTFSTSDFAGALAFAVRVGMLAEKRDHHPDILIGWGKAKVLWTTHDAKGITQLDLDLASATDALAPG